MVIDYLSRFPLIAASAHAWQWLRIQQNLGLSQNTIAAYGRSLEDYLSFCNGHSVHGDSATREHIALYVRHLSTRPNPRGANVLIINSGIGLSNATMQQRITAIRLYYDHLIEEGVRQNNPVGRGRFTKGKGFGGARERGLIPRYRKLPWIPSEAEWDTLVEAMRVENIRHRLMFLMEYDGALRPEELCFIEIGDIDPAHRLLNIRPETTKNRQGRVVPYSEGTGALLQKYLQERRRLNRHSKGLFLSHSRRNYACPISKWTWFKIVRAVAIRARIERFTAHSLRHLRLTDLARAGWDVKEIAKFAGHRSFETTQLYIHLSGRELAEKLKRGMNSIHAWRVNALEEAF
jgi:integrase/recombinase XerD